MVDDGDRSLDLRFPGSGPLVQLPFQPVSPYVLLPREKGGSRLFAVLLSDRIEQLRLFLLQWEPGCTVRLAGKQQQPASRTLLLV